MHRLMVTSAAYRQSSRPDPQHAADDPENEMFGRMNRRRLDAEGIRDAMLAVSGELNPRMGGPGVLAPLEKEVKDLIFTEAEVVDLWPEDRDPAEHLRRSLYLFRKRNVRYPLLDAFDAPDTQSACPRRETSTHSLQALALLNSDFAAGRARALAGRVLREAGADAEIGSDAPTSSCSPASRSRSRSSGHESFLKAQTDRIRSETQVRRATVADFPPWSRPRPRRGSTSPWHYSIPMNSFTYHEDRFSMAVATRCHAVDSGRSHQTPREDPPVSRVDGPPTGACHRGRSDRSRADVQPALRIGGRHPRGESRGLSWNRCLAVVLGGILRVDSWIPRNLGVVSGPDGMRADCSPALFVAPTSLSPPGIAFPGRKLPRQAIPDART